MWLYGCYSVETQALCDCIVWLLYVPGYTHLETQAVCIGRCILTATRYSLRILGLKQAQVKQLLHVVRRGFVARVKEDLSAAHRALEASDSSDKTRSVPRGLQPSQLQLVQLASQMCACSAVKESKAGRLNAEALRQVTDEIQEVNRLASGLPIIDAGANTNDWMLLQVPADLTIPQPNCGNFDEASVSFLSGSEVVGADDAFAGPDVVSPTVKLVDFLAMPSDAVSDFWSLLRAVQCLQEICSTIRNDNTSATNQCLQIASLIEHSFTVVLPAPVWADPSSVWHATDLKSFQSIREALRWLAYEYSAVTLSVPVPCRDDTNAAIAFRAVTNTAIMCAFFETVRAGPGLPVANGHGDHVVAELLRQERIGFPTLTRGGQDFAVFTDHLPMTDLSLIKMRAALCLYIFQMKSNTDTLAFDFAPSTKWQLNCRSPSVVQTLTVIHRLTPLSQHFARPAEQIFQGVCVHKFSKSRSLCPYRANERQQAQDLNDLQRAMAWLTQSFSQGDEWDHLDSWLALRDMVTLFPFALSCPNSVLKSDGKVFSHTEKGHHPHEGVVRFADTFGFEFKTMVTFDTKLEIGTLQRGFSYKCSNNWDSDRPPNFGRSFRRSYPLSPANTQFYRRPGFDECVDEEDVVHADRLIDFGGSISQVLDQTSVSCV